MNINKSIPTNHIKLIRDYLSISGRPVIFKSVSLIEEWKEQGCPHVIELVEQYDNAYCYIDNGYGYILLIVEDKNLGTKIKSGKYMCVIDDIIALDKEAYGTESYIFKGNANHE